jgi:hypothetical protein
MNYKSDEVRQCLDSSLGMGFGAHSGSPKPFNNCGAGDLARQIAQKIIETGLWCGLAINKGCPRGKT